MSLTLRFRKSSYSGSSDNCVEVARHATDLVAVRDSKDPQGPALAFTPAEWAAFAAGVKAGAFDLG